MNHALTLCIALALALGAGGCKVTVAIQRAELEPLAVTARAPAPPPPKRQKRERIKIRDKIMFETGKATILRKSHAILDDVVKVMQDRARIRVQVEGHTDSQGSPEMNRTLSQQRAEAVVKYLVGKGIDASRLVAKGFGPDQPVADNNTAEGREANRRVEFLVMRRSRQKGETP